MTERGRASVARSPDMFRLGRSSLHWRDGVLEIAIDEICAPIPKRIRGRIRVTPPGLTGRSFAIDRAGRHIWHPIAPRARIDVTLDTPAIRWSGNAYLDSNRGTEPLEAGFAEWTWSRAHLPRDSVVFYDAKRHDGSGVSLALRFDPSGGVEAVDAPPPATLPVTGWRISRRTRADPGQICAIRRTLEDTPFYARSHIATTIFGEPAECIHESLNLGRFASPVVRAMLPFRMPRSIL